LRTAGAARYWYSHFAMRTQAVVILAILFGPALAAAQTVAWRDVLEQPPAWYRTTAAAVVADNVLAWQRPNGGWPKDIDMTVRPTTEAIAPPSLPDSTIDNGATVTQIRLLDRLVAATGHMRYRNAALRGIDYLFAAQYANGGWPQFYPLRNDYSRHITFNDDAMSGVLSVLEDVVGGRVLSFVDEARRARAAAAIESATALILRAQIRVNGQLTAWCAQHDAATLEPRPARAYEHVSLSGRESADIIRFLMRRPYRPEIVEAVEAAVGWLRRVRLTDGTWARFYELGTNRPIYSGRDGVVRYDISEIEAERRTGYAWLGDWPARVIESEYPRWRVQISASPAR
jgi:PelA/Pel-15E family pectate lyase